MLLSVFIETIVVSAVVKFMIESSRLSFGIENNDTINSNTANTIRVICIGIYRRARGQERSQVVKPSSGYNQRMLNIDFSEKYPI